MYIPKMRQSKGEEELRHESMGGVGLAEIENVKWDEGDKAWKRRRGEVFIEAKGEGARETCIWNFLLKKIWTWID